MRNRYRHKGDDDVYHYTWYAQRTNPTAERNWTWDRVASTHSSDIYDSVGPLPRVDNPVLHRRRNVVIVDELPVLVLQQFGGDYLLYPHKPFRLPHDVDPGGPDVNRDYEQFLRYSSEWFFEQFRSKVSLANFLIELKDFRKVVGSLRKVLFSGIKSLRANASREFRDRLGSGIGSNYLDYVFNWKPLIEDVPKLLSAYKDAMKRYLHLVSQSKWIDHRRIRFTVDPGEKGFDSVLVADLADESVLMGGGIATYKIWLRPAWSQVTMNASARIENKLHLDTGSQWEAVADQLGLNNGPKVLWNATKLSWLVDFFIDSHDFFKAFEVETFKGHLGVDGGTASVKIECAYDITCQYSDTSFSTVEVALGSVLYRTYRRDNLLLRRGSLLSITEALTPDQQLILAALAESQSNNLLLGGRTLREWKSTFSRNVKTFGRSKWKRVFPAKR